MHIRTIIIILLLTNISIFSENKVSESKIETILHTYNYQVHDLSIPKDRLFLYPNRLKIFDDYLNTPLSAFPKMSALADKLSNSYTPELIKEALKIVGVQAVKEIPLNVAISTSIMNYELGNNIDTLLDFQSSLILRPYLNIFINAQSMIIKDVLQKDNTTSRYLRGFTKDLLSIINNENNSYKSEDFNQYANILQYTAIFEIAYNLYMQLQNLNERLMMLPDATKSSAKTNIINTKYGKIAIGSVGNDEYTGNFIAIIDLGGDDTYNLEQFDNQSAYFAPVRFIIDFDGNDKYYGKDYNLGSGYFGINYIIDYKGNDSYKADNFSVASAICGVGLIEDSEGNDKYINKNFGIAASFMGVAILNDKKGDDTYESANFSQSFSTTLGMSILRDNDGNDKYINNESNGGKFLQASSIGNEVSGAAGLSLLIDKYGDDYYQAKYKSQSFATNNGISILKDYSGDDTYKSLIYSQASSQYNSLALLNDVEGNDKYLQPFGNQSNSRAYAYSMFFDEQGSDYYIESKNELNQTYVSLFFDTIGKDTLVYNINYMPNSENYTPALGLLKSTSVDLYLASTLDSTSVDRILQLNDKIIKPEYSKELSKALELYVNDTLLFEQIEQELNKLSVSDLAVFAYHYVVKAKNNNLEQATMSFLHKGNEFISKSTIEAILVNPALKSELLLELVNSDIDILYKKLLAEKFLSTNFNQQSTKEFRKGIIELPKELKLLIYPAIKNNRLSKSMKNKIKDIIKNEKDLELKKILQDEK
ncbi:MAG TPA: hypothetical protein PLE30_06290 [Candidatus Kapabacteria bacterium]|nr:hypothetical protein [Candidatus Kapabacteria bacterium]